MEDKRCILEVKLFVIGQWLECGEREVSRCKDISQVLDTSMHAGLSTDPRPPKAVKPCHSAKVKWD